MSQARALAASNEQLERRIAATAAATVILQPDAASHPEAAASKLPNGVARQQPAPEGATGQQLEGQQTPEGIPGATSETPLSGALGKYMHTRCSLARG